MPSAMAAGEPIHLVGYTWRSGALALLWRPWPARDPRGRASEASLADPHTWPLSPGASLHLVAARPGMPGERRCIGYRPPRGGPPLPCPDGRALPAGSHAQCAACDEREGRLEVVASDGSRPPTGPRAEYLLSAHEVYLAAFAPDVLKVGVSGAGRTPLRVLEQGAPVGLIVGRAYDGMAARRLEAALSQVGARQRVQARMKLRLLYPPPEADALQARLADALERMEAALPGGWPADVERLEPPRALDFTPLLHLDALGAPPVVAFAPPAGRITGQMVAAAGPLLMVRQPQPTLWGEVTPPIPEAHDLRAWLGWRVLVGSA
jgi:hypothetical protein